MTKESKCPMRWKDYPTAWPGVKLMCADTRCRGLWPGMKASRNFARWTRRSSHPGPSRKNCAGYAANASAFTIALLQVRLCGINRTSSEPPSHHECAVWSAVNCPFLSNPRMVRREDEEINNQRLRDNAAGFAITRNPGVAMIWNTRQYEVFKTENGYRSRWASLNRSNGLPMGDRRPGRKWSIPSRRDFQTFAGLRRWRRADFRRYWKRGKNSRNGSRHD